MGIIDSYQQKQLEKQLELEAEKEQERKKLISRCYEFFDILLNDNAEALKEQIVKRGIFEGGFVIRTSFWDRNDATWLIEEPYFSYNGKELILKDGFTYEKRSNFFLTDDYYVEQTKEGAYYINEICKRFLNLIELGVDEVFRYKAAIQEYTNAEPNELPCKITENWTRKISSYRFAIKYSLTKRK